MKYISIISILISLYSCGNGNKIEADTESNETSNILMLTDEQMSSLDLSTTGVEEREIVKQLRLNGIVEVPPQNFVSASNALGGYIKETRMLPGTYFKKGQILAVLEDNQYIQLQEDYLTVQTELGNAETEYRRQKELNASKASSDKIYQKAKSDYETLLISSKALEEKLKLIHMDPRTVKVDKIKSTVNLYAPFDGYIKQSFVNVGAYISPSDVIFELVNPNGLYLNLKVFEKDWADLKVGMPVKMTNSSHLQSVMGKILLVGKAITQQRTVDVFVSFDKYEPFVIPGLYMNADIETVSGKTWALPEESVIMFEGKNYIFRSLGSNSFELMPVTVGQAGKGWVEIVNIDSIQESEIVRNGAYTLLMALKNEGEEE